MHRYMTTLMVQLNDDAQWARHERNRVRPFSGADKKVQSETNAGYSYALSDMEAKINQAVFKINLLSQSNTSTLGDALKILMDMREDFETEHQQINYATSDYARGRANMYQKGVYLVDSIIGELKDVMAREEHI
jgi:hypothetical protein